MNDGDGVGAAGAAESSRQRASAATSVWGAFRYLTPPCPVPQWSRRTQATLYLQRPPRHTASVHMWVIDGRRSMTYVIDTGTFVVIPVLFPFTAVWATPWGTSWVLLI